MNTSLANEPRGVVAAVRQAASSLADLIRHSRPPMDAGSEQAFACGKLALRVARGMRAGARSPERTDLLLLALINARAAVLSLDLVGTQAEGLAGQRPEGGGSVEPELARILQRTAEEDISSGGGQVHLDLELLLAHAEKRLRALEEPMRRARRAQLRATAVALALLLPLLFVVAFGGWLLFGERELSAGKPWTTSSSAMTCNPEHKSCGGAKTSILFHTAEESEPWFEIDLGQVQELTRIEVTNRSDCCPERAVPLIVEVSLDKLDYRRVARRFSVFDRWSQRFAATRARYVRLRVARRSFLHLEQVRVFGHRLEG